jgi:hypothetical protein
LRVPENKERDNWSWSQRAVVHVTTPIGIQQVLCVITAMKWAIGHVIAQDIEVVALEVVKAQVQGKVIRAQPLVGVSCRHLLIKESGRLMLLYKVSRNLYKKKHEQGTVPLYCSFLIDTNPYLLVPG